MSRPKFTLKFTSDTEPGFTRKRCGRGFAYYDVCRKLIRQPEIKARINGLAIPPAYRDVWICTAETGHLQATGLDGRERKQYRYHPEWQNLRNERKFEKLLEFGRVLPSIRHKVQNDLQGDGVPEKNQVISAAVRLIDHTGARIGNDAYTKVNGTHGVTTLEKGHLKEVDGLLHLRYEGKGRQKISFDIDSPAISRVLHRCSELEGERLFRYENERGEVQTVHSHDVNQYLQQIAEGVTAKDFRTWKATLLCFSELVNLEIPEKDSDRTKMVNKALKNTAARLYHRASTCRIYYVHPAVIDSFMSGRPLTGPIRFRKNHSPREHHAAMEKSLISFLESHR